jgi:hypothetical protein
MIKISSKLSLEIRSIDYIQSLKGGSVLERAGYVNW